MGRTIGIDLGTTNSCMAYMEGGESKVIHNAEGKRTTPSVVGYNDEGERLVGEVAKNQAILNSDQTVMSVKRHMGDGDWTTELDGEEYTPEQISAFILQKLKSDAEAHLGDPVDKAVITVPAYFGDAQRQATKDAGKIAGLEVLRIINEPTAAALAYGLGDEDQDQTILVYDLGGGTFDVSILELGDGVFEVQATSGDNELGGDDFDERIMDWLVEEFKNEEGIDLREDRQAMQRLKKEAENAKKELSSTTTTEINLPFITADQSGPKHLNQKLTRKKFEKLIDDLLDRTVKPMKQAMSDADVDPDDLDEVLLVGGSTRIPRVQELVKKVTGRDPSKKINPDEVVARGAAIQAGVLEGDVKDVLLLDVTPLSLGLETMGGVFTKLIERNTTIPTKKSEIFTTAADNQTQVEIKVYQGEREIAEHNNLLGTFTLTDIPPAPRGTPQIEVTFDIDANGILNVSAEDKATGNEQNITITGSSNLAEDEIEEMVQEAQAHEEEDKRKRRLAEARNELDTLVYRTKKNLQEHGDKLDESQRNEIQDKLDKAQDALDSEDPEHIEDVHEELLESSYQLSEHLYQDVEGAQAGAGAGPGGAAGPGAAGGPGGPQPGQEEWPADESASGNGAQAEDDEDVIEAEVIDEDEEEEQG